MRFLFIFYCLLYVSCATSSVVSLSQQPSKNPCVNLKKEIILRTNEGTYISKRFSKHNGSVSILDYNGYRGLLFEGGNTIESLCNKNDPKELPLITNKIITLGLAYPQKPKKILMIGMGGGSTTRYIQYHVADAIITNIEIDPEVIKLSEEYFGVSNNKNFKIIKDDGVKFLEKSTEQYDLIIIDAYGNNDSVPCANDNFYKQVAKHLSSDGVVVQNIFLKKFSLKKAIKRIGKSFRYIDLYDAGGNIIVIGYNSRITRDTIVKNATSKQRTFNFNYDLVDLYTCFYKGTIHQG